MQWSIDLHPVTGEWRIIDRVGEIVCVSLHGEQHLAKIAAAPDMFEALLTALPYIECAEEDDAYKPGIVAKVTAQIRAALTKAGLGQRADATPNPTPDRGVTAPVTLSTDGGAGR